MHLHIDELGGVVEKGDSETSAGGQHPPTTVSHGEVAPKTNVEAPTTPLKEPQSELMLPKVYLNSMLYFFMKTHPPLKE